MNSETFWFVQELTVNVKCWKNVTEKRNDKGYNVKYKVKTLGKKIGSRT